MRGLLVALGFLTRIPVPPAVFSDARARVTSLAWYPLVGLLIGALLCIAKWLLRDTAPMLSAAIVVAVWVAITGALHLDGLADSADAWMGGMGNRERTLEIMKDPRCGPAGVVALTLVLLLKFAALASLPKSHGYTFLLAPMLARAALTGLFLTTPYVRRGGLGEGLSHAPRLACWAAITVTAVVCALFFWRGCWALLVALGVFGVWRHACMQRLGGFTGDTAGALAEIIEVGVLVVLALG